MGNMEKAAYAHSDLPANEATAGYPLCSEMLSGDVSPSHNGLRSVLDGCRLLGEPHAEAAGVTPAGMFAAYTVRGGRTRNEDGVLVAGADGKTLLVLADGMGGPGGGFEAARTLLDAFGSAEWRGRSPAETAPQLVHKLKERYEQVWAKDPKRSDLANMGATYSAIEISSDSMAVSVHQGDVRTVIIRNGYPVFYTTLHEIRAFLKINQDIPPAGGLVVNSARLYAGLPELMEQPEIHALELRGGDRIVLASDGLVLSPSQIAVIVSRAANPLEAVRALGAAWPEPQDNQTVAVLFHRPETRP